MPEHSRSRTNHKGRNPHTHETRSLRHPLEPNSNWTKGGDSTIFKLCVGGQPMITYKEFLNRFPETPLHQIAFKKEIAASVQGRVSFVGSEVFIDENPAAFRILIDVYREGELHRCPSVCPLTLQQLLRRWSIEEALLSECCFPSYNAIVEDCAGLKALKNSLSMGIFNSSSRAEGPVFSRLKRKVWHFIMFPRHSRWAMSYAIFSNFLTLGSICWLVVGSIKWVREYRITNCVGNCNTNNQSRLEEFLLTKPPLWLLVVDYCVTTLLMAELCLLTVSCPDIVGLLKQFFFWVDFVSILPNFIAHIIELTGVKHTPLINKIILIFYLCGMVRVFRLLHLGRIFPSIRVLTMSLAASFSEIMLLFFLIVATSIVFGVAIFYAEITEENTQVLDVPTGMWWAIITITTVGYGDVSPSNQLGRIVAAICAFWGVLVVVMPIPIVTGNFILYYNYFRGRWHLL